MKIKFLFIPISIFFVFCSLAYSQTQLPQLINSDSGLPLGITEQISTTIIPKIPAPGENISILIESFSSNLNKAHFIWKANGFIIEQGMGITKIEIKAPEIGNTLKLDVVITKEEGGLIQRTFTFSPAEVDVIYEAETYTHPFYKGKPIFTSESVLRFVALANFVNSKGQTLNPNELVYTWKIDDTVVQESSGFGKRVFRYQGGLVQNDTKVGVEVSAINSDLMAKNAVFIYAKQPEVILYEKNPLLGVVYEKGVVGSFLLNRPEVELQSVPYFFSTKQKDNSYLDYTWKINGEAVETTSRSSYSRFRNDTGKAGVSLISLDVQHFYNILQFATTNIELNYEENKNILEANLEL